mmetsp:Transcript_1187/g.2595  ORF Transcript_1187/g.2595 Transcript_1187/m.2595 type:complete len:381 (-) Transcript_1187:152-1294(-)
MASCAGSPAFMRSTIILSRIIISLHGMFYWFQLAQLNVADAFYSSQIQQSRVRHYAPASSPLHRLYGISEWRAKFAPSTTSNSSQVTADSSLPLLLLPFKPTQILLPGQSTTLKFRHGKYMDMIDESLTSYESVVGMSILDEDGLLPHVVVCEVLEEELEVNMGYRGFGGMEVGVRAVGRAKRIPNGEESTRGSSRGGDDISFRGRTALDDIHLGQFVEWQDDALDANEFKVASEYLGNINGLLMLSQQSNRKEDDPPSNLDGRIQHQQMLFAQAYETILKQFTAMSTNSSSRQQQHAQLMASSWATLAATEGSDARSASIITQALSTTDTVERLRLGLAMMLEGQMPKQSDVADTSSNMEKKIGYSVDSLFDNQENTFQ